MQFKKSLFVLSVICCLFLCSSAFAQQFGDFTCTVSNNTVTIIKYTGTGGNVVIPDTINSMPVVGLGYHYDEPYLQNVPCGAFLGCTSLTSVFIPISVTYIAPSFWGTGLGNPYLNKYGTFAGCSALTTIDVDASNPSYSSQDGVLYNKDKSAIIFYPRGKSGGFTLPSSVERIEYNAFDQCPGLTSVTIPSSVTIIGEYAFRHCTGLTSMIIPGSITSIGAYAFNDCTGLTSLTIPGSVATIGEYAFYECTGLTSAYFYGNAPAMGFHVFSGCASGFTVYYLAGATGFTNPWYGYPTAVFTLPDADGDGIDDFADNCPAVANPQQLDADTDGIGDVCDPEPGCGGCGQTACEYVDTDGDGIQNYSDNCPDTANPQQLDADTDGIGDACDSTPGCGGGCGQAVCENQVDTDGDYVRDGMDNCPATCNYSQLDADSDGAGDVCDADPGCGADGQPVCEAVCTL